MEFSLFLAYPHNYDMFVQKLSEVLNRHISCKTEFFEGTATFPCEYFTAWVHEEDWVYGDDRDWVEEKEDWKSKYAEEVHDVKINANVYIQLFSKTAEKGICIIFKVINDFLKITVGDILLEDNNGYVIFYKRTKEGLWGENHKNYDFEFPFHEIDSFQNNNDKLI